MFPAEIKTVMFLNVRILLAIMKEIRSLLLMHIRMHLCDNDSCLNFVCYVTNITNLLILNLNNFLIHTPILVNKLLKSKKFFQPFIKV